MKKVKNWLIAGVIVGLSLYVIKLFCKPSVQKLAVEVEVDIKQRYEVKKRDMFSGRKYIKVPTRDNSEVEEFVKW